MIEVGALVKRKTTGWNPDDAARYRVIGEIYWGLGVGDDPPFRQLILYKTDDGVVGEVPENRYERVEE